jgi:hypothetical protein
MMLCNRCTVAVVGRADARLLGDGDQQTANTGGSASQPGPAIGIVRPQGQFIQQGGNIGIRNCEAGRIDRSGERRILEPPPKPSSQSKLVEPQRRLHERLEKPLALPRVEPRPALHRRHGQISAPHLVSLKAKFSKGKSKNKKTKYAERVPSRGPPGG